MTPAEARQIDSQEFAAESKAALQRALAYSRQCRKQERQQVRAWIKNGKEELPVKFVYSGRTVPLITFNGTSRTLAQWAARLGIAVHSLTNRRRRLGSMEAAIAMGGSTSGGGRQPMILEHDGQSRPLHQWAAMAGLKPDTIHHRLRGGWSIAHALTTPAGQRPGVSPDFAPSSGTGAGSTVQETPNITFSGKVENA